MKKKPKIIKLSISEALQKVETGKIKLVGDEQKIQHESLQALNRLGKGNPGFVCKHCGLWFQPQPKQWIFHELCDACFAIFDRQKMIGRFDTLIEKKKASYFEDADEWIQHESVKSFVEIACDHCGNRSANCTAKRLRAGFQS